MICYFMPKNVGHDSQIRQNHFRIHYFPKTTFPASGANGNVIGAVPAIIPVLPTGGGDAVSVLKFV
jgi:hypothetical protein